MAAKMMASDMVITLTTTIKSSVFSTDCRNFISRKSLVKFSKPTNVRLDEKPPHLYRDMRKILKVGRIMKTKNRSTAGSTHIAMNLPLPFCLSKAFPPLKGLTDEKGRGEQLPACRGQRMADLT